MRINIKKAETIAECEECNQMLCELIKYEIAFDESIVPRTNISDHYERILNKDDAIIFCVECDNKSAGYVAAYKNTPKTSNIASTNNNTIIISLNTVFIMNFLLLQFDLQNLYYHFPLVLNLFVA